MEKQPHKIEDGTTIEDINFRIVEKNDKINTEVMDLLHQYPDHFIPELFEQEAQRDFSHSDVAIAYDKDLPVGCLMFNKTINEFNWLAVNKNAKASRLQIAQRLFETFYPTIEPGTTAHFFVNTQDASIPGHPSFSGKNFESAQRLYRSMGFEMKEENRVENKYGPGAHTYRVEWTPIKKEAIIK